MKPTAFLTFLLLFLQAFMLCAQDKKTAGPSFTIRGTVMDSTTGETLVGVNVYLKGRQTGTVTNTHGEFILPVASGQQIIVFSFVGYNQKEITVQVNGDQRMAVILSLAKTRIEEVQVSGQRKFFGNMDYGREIPSIDAKVIEGQNENNASDILHARVAGVWATKTSGLPGDHEKIRIRGQNSFFSSAEPLYVVDGVPVPIVNLSSLGIADLNIHDIASVTILKDASSTALYGFQGGNGVVLIDTKQGGENEITFTNRIGIQKFTHFYDQMNSKDFITSLNDASNNFHAFQHFFYPSLNDPYSYDNWQKEIFQTGFIHEHQLSASGKKGKTNYYISANYTGEGGILPNSDYKRYTLSAKAGRVFWNKLAIQAGYRGSLQDNRNNQDLYLGNPLLFEGITKPPCLRDMPDSLLYNPVNHQLNPRIYYKYDALNSPDLPQAIIDNVKNSLDITSHIIHGSAKLQITDHLSLNAMESLMLRYSKYDYQYYTTFIKSNEDVFLYNHQYSLSYFNTFGKHKVDLAAAYRFYQDNLWWHVDTMEGQLSVNSYLRNSMAAYGPDGSVIRTLSSYVANASYSYNETYFLSLVANVSHIKEGIHIHYYELFPSVAASLDLAKLWPLNRLHGLDHFSPYANWGISGNYPLNGLANDLYENVNYTYGTTPGSGPAVVQFANHFLKHESTSEMNYGIKTSLFNDRLELSAVYYMKNIDNLIIKRAIPDYYLGGEQYLNLGMIHVRGKELSLEATPLETKDFYWDIGFNFSASHQKVERLDKGTSLTFLQTYEVLMPEFIIKKGDAMGNIYGYQNLGKWTSADAAARNKLYVQRGQMKYLNADSSNNILNINDAVILGNSVPAFNWNLYNTFHYKNFTLNMVWYAVEGVQKFNITRGATLMTGTNRDVYKYINDSVNAMSAAEFYRSSELVENAGFIRLKTISLSYETVQELIPHTGIKFAIGFENLLTITGYKGYDPEATTFTDNNFSDNAVDRGAVPNPRSVYISLTLKIK